MWGSNDRETHPIFFHHVIKAIHEDAKIYVVDPRRSQTAQSADAWLGLDVGTDIALAYGIAREIINPWPGQRHVHRTRHRRLRGVRRRGGAVDPRTDRADDRRARRVDPRAHSRLRHSRQGTAVLDARDYRAPQRNRQCALADQTWRYSPATSDVTAPA